MHVADRIGGGRTAKPSAARLPGEAIALLRRWTGRPALVLGRRVPRPALVLIGLAALIFVFALLGEAGALSVPTPTRLGSAVLFGIITGSLYALIAVGYSLVYGILKFINFAHGDVAMVGAYAVFAMVVPGQNWDGLPLAVALIAAVLFCALLGAGIERVAYRPLRKASRLAPLVTAIGVSLLLQAIIQSRFTGEKKVANLMTTGTVLPGGTPLNTFLDAPLAGLPISVLNGLILLVAACAMAGTHVLVTRTRMGVAMRAAADDLDTAALVGVPVNRVVTATFVLGSALAGVSGIAYALRIENLQPGMGFFPGLKGFTGAVVGGIGSIPGAFLGGILIGLVEEVGVTVLPVHTKDALAFIILIIVLLIRPQGILGRSPEVRR